MLETTIEYYTGQNVSHLGDAALVMKNHQLTEVRRLEAEEKNGQLNL
jgi:hypothetical protein